MKKSFNFLILFIPSILLGQISVDNRIHEYDVLHYNVSITPIIKNNSFIGNVEIIAKPQIQLNEFVLCANNSTLSIDLILDNKKSKLFFEHKNNHIYIKFLKPQKDTLSLSIYYHGISDFHGEFDNGGIFFQTSENNIKIATSSQPFFTRKWFPCKDIPSDKATANININIPENLTAVSNGILKDVLPNNDGTRTFRWETKYPIATYLISFAVGNYISYEETHLSINNKEMTINYNVYPEYLENAKKDFSNTKKMLMFLEKYFGEYPFINEKYGIVLVPGNLTMENQTISSIQEDLITGNGDAEIFLIHELAHQWWGNMITPKTWHHTWLSEGFATYAQALYYEHYLGKEYYHKLMNHYMSAPMASFAGSIVIQSDTSFEDIFSDRVYLKGAIVLHMLRYVVGDSNFFVILRNYTTNPKYKYSNVTTEDFIKECENVHGEDLKWFFDQWVYAHTDSIDRPVINYKWEYEEKDKIYKVKININQQTASTFLYKLPIEISILTANQNINYNIINDEADQYFEFFIQEKPNDVILDEQNWLFKILKSH